MPIKKVLLIVNPASRRGARVRHKAEDAFQKAGVTLDVMETKAPGHGSELAAAHGSKYDAVFTLGGDGTAIEVIGALAHIGPPVGVLPGGTGNIVARTLGTCLLYTSDAADERSSVDLGGRRIIKK